MGDFAPWQDRDANNEDDDDDVDENQYRDQKDAILFLIHVSPTMVKATPQEGKSALKTALECAYDLLLQKIISNPNDMMGILLFGTEKTKVEGNYSHLYNLMDLGVPDASGIKEVKRLLNDDKALYDLCKPSKEPASMANVLFAANTLLTSKAARFGSRRVFLVTDDDSPGTKDQQKSAITRARDLNDLGIRLEPFFISHPDRPPFDLAKFYENVIYRDDEDQDDGEYHLPTDASARFETLLNMIKAKQTPRRSQFNILMELAPGMQIGIKGFILVKRQEIRRTHYVYNQEERPALAQVESADIDPGSSQVIPKEAVQRAFKFGGEYVVFTPDELKEIRSFGDPILRILGFKPMSALRFWDNMRPSYFIYPSDAAVTGSTRTFASLHKKLLKDDLMALAWLIPRRNQAPVFAAVIPQAEEFDDKEAQITPPGMHCIVLPFRDDIRANPVDGTVAGALPHAKPVLRTAGPEITDKMGEIICAVKFKSFNPAKYPNPALQWHYRVLQAYALEEEVPEKKEDKTIPKYNALHKRTGPLAVEWGELLAVEWGELLDSEVRAGGAVEPTKKRKAVTNGKEDGGEVDKKIKREKKPVEAASKDKVESFYEQGTLMTLKLDQLKEACAQYRVSAGKTKAQCVEALEEFFSRR